MRNYKKERSVAHTIDILVGVIQNVRRKVVLSAPYNAAIKFKLIDNITNYEFIGSILSRLVLLATELLYILFINRFILYFINLEHRI